MGKKQSNDSKILELKRVIDLKKQELLASPKKKYATNGSIKLSDGRLFNIHALTKLQCIEIVKSLLIDRDFTVRACELLDIDYPIVNEDMLEDVMKRYVNIDTQEKESALSQLEAELEEKLSEEYKQNEAIDSIGRKLLNL